MWSSFKRIHTEMLFLIGNGKTTCIWWDPRLVEIPLAALPLEFDISPITDAKVSNLINHNSSTWDWIKNHAQLLISTLISIEFNHSYLTDLYGQNLAQVYLVLNLVTVGYNPVLQFIFHLLAS